MDFLRVLYAVDVTQVLVPVFTASNVESDALGTFYAPVSVGQDIVEREEDATFQSFEHLLFTHALVLSRYILVQTCTVEQVANGNRVTSQSQRKN